MAETEAVARLMAVAEMDSAAMGFRRCLVAKAGMEFVAYQGMKIPSSSDQKVNIFLRLKIFSPGRKNTAVSLARN